MSRQSFAQALQQMQVHLSEQVVDFTSRKVHEISEEIKEEIQLEYDDFFPLIVRDVIGAFSTPGVFQGLTHWEPLSDQWQHMKATGMHYVGMSNSSTMGKTLSRGQGPGASRLKSNGNPSSGLVKTGSFSSYIESLNKAGTTARFFGPVSITYDFVAPNPALKVYPKQVDGVVSRTDIRQGGKFFKFNGDLEMTAKIEAFTSLKGVSFDEWHIVDYIIKRIDPANEKQWVKINSRYGIGRSRRPIRAVITPILEYFMSQRFPKIVRDAVTARR